MTTTPTVSVIQAPSGRFIFVGRLPVILASEVPATDSDVMGGRAHRSTLDGTLQTWKFPSFPTREDAVTFARVSGVEVVS